MTDETDKAPEPPDKRCWYQYSLRSLLIIAAAVAAICTAGHVVGQQFVPQERFIEMHFTAAGLLFLFGFVFLCAFTPSMPWSKRIKRLSFVALFTVPTIVIILGVITGLNDISRTSTTYVHSTYAHLEIFLPWLARVNFISVVVAVILEIISPRKRANGNTVLPSATKLKKPFQYSILSLLIWTTVIAGFLALVLSIPPISSGRREAARSNTCSSNLRQIVLALHNYQSAHGNLPPAYIVDENGKPMHSWRVLILPYLEEGDELFQQYDFNEPWDGPNNSKLHDEFVLAFRCPSDPGPWTMTNFVAVVGPTTAWPGKTTRKLEEFSDGNDKTIQIIEVANSGIHWMEPKDLDAQQVSIFSMHPGMAYAGFANGSVHALPTDLKPEMLKDLLTVDGGEDVSEFFGE